MGKKTPYRGKPHKAAATIISDLYDRRCGREDEGNAHVWDDLPTGDVLVDVLHELLGENDD